MRRSVVSSSSNPASSAAFNSAPLLSVSQPLACAVWTVCPDSEWTSPFGVPWSKRTSTGGDWVGAQALSHELENGRHLLARHVELLNDLVDAEILEILNDRGHGQTGALEHPGTTDPVRDAFDDRTPRPVKRCHEPTSSISRLLDVIPAVTWVHAVARSPCSRRSHPAIWFQLANV